LFRCLLTAFVMSLLVSALLTRYIRNFAVVRGWVRAPDPGRHVHGNPVPRLGGVAIFVSVLTVVAGGLWAPKWLGLWPILSVRMALGILAPAALIFLIGLYDDARSLGPYPKFVAQIFAALLLYMQGLGIRQFDLLGDHHPNPILRLSLTILWVVLITNAFNLIDGLDGLSAGSALFSTLVVFVLSLVTTNQWVSFLTIALAGAVLGFLRFNFNPATIFLGDSGSLFIGFMLSALALAGSQKAPTMVAVAIPVVSFGLPIMDVAIAVVRRFLSGRPLFRADNEHIHHKLLKLGFSHRHVVFILYGISALFGLLSLTMLHGAGIIALVLVVLGAGMFVGVQQLRYHEFFEMGRVLERAMSQKRIITNNLNIRRATESLCACSDVFTLCRILTETLQPLGFDGVGFQPPATVWLPQSLPMPLAGDSRGGLGCHWTTGAHSEPTWELNLELISSTGKKCGRLSIYRRVSDKPLLMDINLLSDGFYTALSDAMDRAVIQRYGGSQDQNELVGTGMAWTASAS